MVVVLAIMPVFGLIVLGYVLGRRQWLTPESMVGLTKLAFQVFMPAVLFTGIAKADLRHGLSPMLLLGYFGPVLLIFLSVNLIVHWRRREPTAFGLTASYSNNVLIGIPLVASLMGPENLVYVFAVLALHSLALFSLQSFYIAFGGTERVSTRELLSSLANPLIIGLMLGAALNISELTLPAPVWQIAMWLAQAGLPCALIVLGVNLSRYRLRPSFSVLSLTAIKLLVFPFVVWALCLWLPGLNNAARSVLMLMAACPSGVNVLAFARTAEENRVVSSTVFLSTVLAGVTVPLWMALVGLAH
jgi:predicted permease